MKDRQKNIFKIAMYYMPDESVITRVKESQKSAGNDVDNSNAADHSGCQNVIL